MFNSFSIVFVRLVVFLTSKSSAVITFATSLAYYNDPLYMQHICWDLSTMERKKQK